MKTATSLSLLACLLAGNGPLVSAQTAPKRPAALPPTSSFTQHYAAWQATNGSPLTAQTQVAATTGKIPLTAAYWYQLNSAGDNVQAGQGLPQLSDGNVNAAVFMGWGKLLANYDSYYEFKDLTNVSISKIRLFDGEGAFADKPFRLYARASATAAPVLLATFTGESYQQWIEITLPQPVPAQYLVINSWYGFPTELELYGEYQTAVPVTLAPQKPVKLADELGINSYIWDFLVNNSSQVGEAKMAPMRAFTQYRDYVDWEKIEPSPGNYTFNPTQNGGWNYDTQYQHLQAEGRDVVACLKTVPGWFLDQYYPADQRDAENVPAPYTADLLNPASYLLQAKLAFQFAARYGRNTSVDTTLLAGVQTGKLYPGDPNSPVRTRARGLGYVQYIECENERDKWWKGRKAYQTAREYAANLSAFYDGHKNTLGAGVGVKNADATMQVVIGGIASTNTDYIRGLIDWCKEFRGYKADGSVNLCFDIINYHAYSNDSGTSQDGNSTRGAAPEVAGSGTAALAFTQLAREYNVPVWITEAGYDVNQGSSLHAPAIGTKTVRQVQADWTLRTALLYARTGINKLFLYRSYDDYATDVANNGTQFASSGLLEVNTGQRTAAADFLYQANKLLGQYTYKETLHSDPVVDRYELNGRSAYVLVMPHETGSTGSYTLSVNGANSVQVYTPTIGRDSMAVQTVSSPGGSLTLTVSETPLFVVPNTTTVPPTLLTQNSSFEDDHAAVQAPIGWQTWGGTEGNHADADYTETYGGAHTGTYHGTHWSTAPYEVFTYQTLTNLPTGLYTLSAWVKSSGGQTYAQLLAKNYGGAQVGVDLRTATPNGELGAWRYVEVPNIQVTNGQCDIGFYSLAAAGQWLHFDDVTLVAQATSTGLQTQNARLADPAAALTGPEGLQLYPNPAQDQVAVSHVFATAGIVDVQLLTIEGKQTVHFQQAVQAGANSWTIPTKAVSPGLYILQVRDGHQVYSHRVSIQH
jgi:hypothetical protein